MTLVAGQADTLHISDLFYAESYALAFLPHATIQARYDRQLGLLILTAAPHAEGLTLLSFRHEGEVYQIPVFLQILQRHRFQYHLRKAAQKVNVMGSFNGWNRNNLPMHDENGDNIYEMILPLEPGRYEYKFVIDTEEILDPENPEIVSNNIGGYNSVLTIPPRHPEKSVLHLLGSKTTGPDLELIFVYERENQPAALRHEHIIALINNQKIAEKKILIVGNQIGVRLDQDLLKGSTTVRVAVTQNGHSTLMQSVRLYDGRPAGSTPAWFSWHDAVIYAMMIDRFDDGDPTNTRPVVHAELHPKVNYFGGDLQGIIRQIDAGYFDSLGVNALWLSPVNENTDRAHREWPPPHRYFSAYHGYWPTHHEKVEERFGDLNLLKTLVAKAHAHGLKVLLDFIAHHVHEDHPFYKAHRDWFGVLDLPDGRKNIRFWDEHRLTTWFEPFLPSFDYLGSQAALDTMTDNAIWWLEQTNADGFRHDAVKHIPNQFWRILTQKIKRQIEIPQNRKIYQIGETFGGYDLVSSYVNNGQLDAQFNFNLYFTARGVFLTPGASFAILANEMQKTFSVYGVDHLMSNIMDSHDQVRYMAYADGDLSLDSGEAQEIGWNNPPEVNDEKSYEKVELYLAYLLTIPGLPTLYYGDEIGLTGAADPDNRRMMRFDAELRPAENRMLQEVRKIVKLRRTHSALRYGDFQTLGATENCFVYLRADLNERLLVVLNKSEQPQIVRIDLPKFYQVEKAVDVMTGREYTMTNHHLVLTIPAIGWQVWKIE